MLPPAPGLFSTTTCWPHISERRAPTMRPIPSMPPPGVNGTTSLTKRTGQACGKVAWAAAPRPPSADASADAADIRTSWRRVSMSASFCGFLPGRGRAVRTRLSTSITDADPGFPDDWLPFRHLGLDQLGKPGRRRGRDHHAHLVKFSPGRGIGNGGNRVAVELAHDLRRSFRRHEQADP